MGTDPAGQGTWFPTLFGRRGDSTKRMGHPSVCGGSRVGHPPALISMGCFTRVARLTSALEAPLNMFAAGPLFRIFSFRSFPEPPQEGAGVLLPLLLFRLRRVRLGR